VPVNSVRKIKIWTVIQSSRNG